MTTGHVGGGWMNADQREATEGWCALLAGDLVCEIINPSDPYTLRTHDFVVAAVAVAVMGHGHLGLKTVDGEQGSPVLFGWDNWFEAQGIEDLEAYVDEHASEMADVLDSVLIGGPGERADVESAAARMSADEFTEWLAERHERKRSSMNDIGGAAREVARRLRASAG